MTATRALLIALVCALILPYVELAWACREGHAATEACVWGRAYFRLNQTLALMIVGPLVFAALMALRALGRRR